MRDSWELTKKRYEAWWHGDLHDRPLLQVFAPRDGAAAEVPWKGRGPTPEEKWTDIDYAIWATETSVARTWYGGEALPAFAGVYSPIGMSAGGALLYGCAPTYAEDTVWAEPLPASHGYPVIAMDPARREWIRSSFEKAGRSSRGRYFIRESFSNQAGDTVAAIRGTERLLMDLAEDPAWVTRAVRQVSDEMRAYSWELLALVAPEITGMDGWISTAGMWSERPNLCADCDVSCMISPRQFEEIFLPPLVETMRDYQYTLYHLDGGDAVRHLDALLACPEVNGIQWIPGAGRESLAQWVPLVKRIQDAGRCVQLLARAEEILPFLDEVSPRGLLFTVSCATEAEGRALVDAVERRSAAATSATR